MKVALRRNGSLQPQMTLLSSKTSTYENIHESLKGLGTSGVSKGLLFLLYECADGKLDKDDVGRGKREMSENQFRLLLYSGLWEMLLDNNTLQKKK